MNHHIVRGDQVVDEVGVENVSLDKGQPWAINHRVEVGEVTGVGERIKYRDIGIGERGTIPAWGEIASLVFT